MAIFVRVAFFAGEMVEGFDVVVTFGFVVFFIEAAVFFLVVIRAEARDVGVDGAAGVAVPDAVVREAGQAVIPAAQELAAPGNIAECAADVFVSGESDVVAEDGQFEFGGVFGIVYRCRRGEDEQALFSRQLCADGDLIGAQRGGLGSVFAAACGQVAVVRAGAGGIGGGQDGRCGVHKAKALQFGAFEFGEGVVDKLAEAVFGGEFAAAGSVGGDAEGDAAIAVFEQPLVNVGFDAREGVVHGRGVRGDDHEFAGGVQDLRGWRQFAGIQHAQRRQFGKE